MVTMKQRSKRKQPEADGPAPSENTLADEPLKSFGRLVAFPELKAGFHSVVRPAPSSILICPRAHLDTTHKTRTRRTAVFNFPRIEMISSKIKALGDGREIETNAQAIAKATPQNDFHAN